MSQEKCCGTCKWWEVHPKNATWGKCKYPTSLLPASMTGKVWPTNMGMSDWNGTDCPTWERREGE